VLFSNLLKIKLFILISISVVIICLANILGGYLFLPGNLDEEKIIIIKPRLSIHKISALLEKENIINNAKLFEVISQIYSYHSPLKSGEYKFTKNITPYQVLRKLVIGRSVVHRLFIPEGYMVSQILDMVNGQERLVGKINGNVPEGYLMPSTYFYTYEDQREKLIDAMRKNMSSALAEVMVKLPKDSPLKTRKDVLILASIIEKEAGNDRERPKIAAVFINRLKKGMKLQADPTTVYAITKGEYKFDRSLKRKDLRIKSPYNTYHIYGLPIGPISCPGRASLEAVVSPAKTNALYFVVNGKGGHSFSKTLKEHNRHVQKFKARVRQQRLAKNKSK
jgi:UPF0755 protein